MPKVKYDVSGEDHERSARGSGPVPKPDWYDARVKKCDPGFAKGDDGKPDRSRPRLEVVYELKKKPYKGAQLFEYYTFGEASRWKLDQFLQAVGINTGKKERGTFDTDDVVGTDVRVRVINESYQGEPRARVKQVVAADVTDEDAEEEDEETEEIEEEETEEEEEETEEEEEEEEEEETKPAPKRKSTKSSAKKAAPKKKQAKSDDDEDDLPF